MVVATPPAAPSLDTTASRTPCTTTFSVRLVTGRGCSTSSASNPSCVGCHEARGALAKWGFDVNYVEKANPTDYQPPATCAICHNPHGSSNPNQLRFPITTKDPEQNLCMKCHL